MSQQDALIELTTSELTQPEPISGPEPATLRVKVWDWPLRLFHWSLLAAVATAIVTGKLGGEWMPVHGKAGQAIVGLVAFRLTWGLVGSGTARFSQFVPTPAQLLDYVKGHWRGIGHNPLGALSVLALLAVLSFQAGTGLFSNDDIAFTGPLASLVTEELSLNLTRWHHQLANVLFILLGLHVAAIAFYSTIKKEKLVAPMVTGWKAVPANVKRPQQARRAGLVLAATIGAMAAYLASGSWIGGHAQDRAVQEAPAQTSASTSRTHNQTPAW